MKLLVLTQYYPPESGAPQNRLSDLAKRLHRRGHQIEVLTALPNYPGNVIFPEYVGRANTVEVLDDVRVARVGILVPRDGSVKQRLRGYLSFAANALFRGPRLVSRPDILMMESPPLFSALAGIPLSRLLRARFVPNISDLWPKSAVEMGMVRPGPSLKAAELLEAAMYRSAALVTVQTAGIQADIKRRFPSVRVELYPNGVDMDMFGRSSPEARSVIRREYGWGDATTVFGYTGLLGLAQALEQVLSALEKIPSGHDVHVAFFGDGPRRTALEARIREHGITRARVYGLVPRDRIADVQNAMDVGLVPLADSPVFHMARPSKMFEFMAAARPIILCARGEAVDIVENDGAPCGLAVPPERPEALAAAMQVLAANAGTRRQMGAVGRALVAGRFDRDAIARSVESILVEAASRKP
jgi:glycosyltransferase involved in cell wall biosynthesis